MSTRADIYAECREWRERAGSLQCERDAYRDALDLLLDVCTPPRDQVRLRKYEGALRIRRICQEHSHD